MHIDLVETWSVMNNLVRTVVIVLTIQALGCIYVTLDRLMLLVIARFKGRKFAKLAGPYMARGDYEGAVTIAREHTGSHLANYLVTGVETYLKQTRNGHSIEKAATLADRALERASERLSASLNRGMNILASTGSTAPFIGLLGTVLGILHAFRLVSQEGSGGMGTIGVAIAEALIVTGYGLMVAIPSVLLFNWLSARITKYEDELDHARGELVDQLHAGGGTGGDEIAATAAESEQDTAAETSVAHAAASA
jgi:biopolymer transport protein ExbB/biopolymer transport protein TolQ